MVYYPKSTDEIIKLIVDDNEAVCECGALMELDYDVGELFRCPACGKTWVADDYFDHGPYFDLVDGCVPSYHDPEMDKPGGCLACGCPAYPECKTACSRFDD